MVAINRLKRYKIYMTNFGIYAIFCSIIRSLSSVSSAVHSPVAGSVETLLLCGIWVGVLVIREKEKGEVLKVRCLHLIQCMIYSFKNFVVFL